MTDPLAVDGGTPVRRELLPYGRQWVDDDDVAAVVEALRADMLTSGPRVPRFEAAFARATGAAHAVAVSSGTAALHAALHVLDLQPGDEVVVPALTFAATANAACYVGARPVFADVDPDTLLLTPETAAACLTPRTRAIVGVDYAGQPCDWDGLARVASDASARLVDDACHALGGSVAGRPVGTLAGVSAFSLHPVKHVTAGEGGVVTTDDAALAARLRRFRNHGIATDLAQREAAGTWQYEMVELGFNYRLTDVQCALAERQLTKLPAWVARRRALAARYDALLAGHPLVRPLATRPNVEHARHLYVVRVAVEAIDGGRASVFRALRAEGIGVQVHYVPVHLHPYYRQHLGTRPGLCPTAEDAAERVLSLPLFPRMRDADVDDVVAALDKVLARYALARPRGAPAPALVPT